MAELSLPATLKFDLTPVGNNADYQVMAYMGQIGVDLLLSDSTNSGVEDFSISEKKSRTGDFRYHEEKPAVV